MREAQEVSVLFSEPKIPQRAYRRARDGYESVSVLFSEPKIPQLLTISTTSALTRFQCSSASRKFLNDAARERAGVAALFQCSSASRKFLKIPAFPLTLVTVTFQCSSASRKFLKLLLFRQRRTAVRFSALQRAENSSIRSPASTCTARWKVSVLFSEPKIPQEKVGVV